MLTSLLLGVLLFQGPGDGWALVHDTRQVKRIYWELFQTTEVWLRLIPEDPEGKPPLVNLIFQAFYPGRAERDPYTGLPREPKGAPARVVVMAQPLPTTLIRDLSLRFTVDDEVIDLTRSGAKYRYLYPCILGDGCAASGVEAELDASVLRSLATTRVVKGEVLGFPIKLTDEDRRALAEFASKVGVNTPPASTRPGASYLPAPEAPDARCLRSALAAYISRSASSTAVMMSLPSS